MAEAPEWADKLSGKLDKLLKVTETQNRLIRFGNLGPDKIVTINHKGRAFDMYVPFGDIDYIQRHLIARRDFYESRFLADLAARKVVAQGGVIIDAGANIGNHSVFFGSFFKPKRLYCFEPQPMVHETLLRNLEINLDKVDIRTHQAMLGGTSGTGEVSVYKQGNIGGAAFAAAEDGDTPMVTLDDTILKGDVGKISFIKMDVEGFQDDVLKGASNILTKSRPPLWIEVLRSERESTDKILAEYGYEATELSRDNVLYTVA